MAKKETKKVEKKVAPKAKVVPTKKLPFEKKKPAKKEKKTSGVTVGVDFALPKMKSFSVTLVIPTQQFGNIQPRIEVEALSFEDAHAFVKPKIEELYNVYAESLPAFMREKITVTERQVEPDQVKEPVKDGTPVLSSPAPTPKANIYTPPAKVETVAGHSVDSNEVPFGPATKSEAYLKAENSIASANTMESLDLIQKKVNESVKIAPEDKPYLDTLILKKKKTIPLA